MKYAIPIIEVAFAIVGFAVRTNASRALSIALDFLPSTKVTDEQCNKQSEYCMSMREHIAF